MLSKRWESAPPNPQVEDKLAAALQIRPLAARLLANRGITSIEAARAFLTPALQRLHDPFLMHGMAEAVHRLTHSLRHQESIVIYGDYDVDGITATAVLSWFFRDIGVPVPYYLPHRMREGYGLNAERFESLPLGHAPPDHCRLWYHWSPRGSTRQTPGNGCDRHRSPSGAADTP